MLINESYDIIEKLAQLMKDKELGKLEVSVSELTIKLEAKREYPPMPPMQAPAAAAAAQAPAALPSKEAVCGNVMTSPIVGTFYSAPAPGKPAFAPVGREVEKGDVVFIIESMKLMNEIQSDFGGRVAELYVRDGQPVEFGQPILRIE